MSELKKNLNEIYNRYYSDVRMIKEFLENIDKLLTRRQKIKKNGISDFSEEDKKELEQLRDFIGSIEDKKTSEVNEITDTTITPKSIKNKSLKLKSNKLGELIWRWAIPIKQKTFLAEMALSYLISYQETFIKEYIKKILISRRELLKCKKSDRYITCWCNYGNCMKSNIDSEFIPIEIMIF